MSHHLSLETLEAQAETMQESPKDHGKLESIVIRPSVDERQVLDSCELSPEQGVHGDRWVQGRKGKAPDPEAQIAVMNSRIIDLVAGNRERWQLAGDNLFVDLDLSDQNIAPGQKFELGSTILEVTTKPHLGCKKLKERFGLDALSWINSEEGRQLHRRGIYVKVVQAGTVRVGDTMKKLNT